MTNLLYFQSILPKSDVPAEQKLARLAPTTVDYLSGLDILSRGARVRLSGIVCTIGPASKATDFLVGRQKKDIPTKLKVT